MAVAPNHAEVMKKEKDALDVLADLYRYSDIGDYASIPSDDVDRFKWFGVYRQKPKAGHMMLRIKIPGGQISPAQLRGISELTDKYARGFGDITTRQTIQLHWLEMKSIRPIFEALRDLGMNSQFACGDCPRNVVSCPLAGVAKDELFDSADLVQELSTTFQGLGKAVSNLPRKFKSSLGSCSIHCQQPQINDLAFYGVRRPNGQTGFGLLVGGGLSDTPHFAQPMRVFVKPEQVSDVGRAVAFLFRDHGYREKRNHARLKFLVADKGWEWTRDQIEANLGYKLERDDSLQHPPAVHSDHMGTGEQRDGNFYIGVPIERGRWTARNMRDIADLADKHGTGEKRIRLTNKQNVMLLDIPKANVRTVSTALGSDAVHLPLGGHPLRDMLISCTGTEFCNLAVAETKHRAGAILKWLEENTEIDFPLFITVVGCPNSCAQYQIADIGLTGTGMMDPHRKDPAGKSLKIEGFKVLLGARIGTDPRFGEVISKRVPSDRVHLSIKNLIDTYKAERADEDETFTGWVLRSEPERLRALIEEPALAPEAALLPA